MTDFPDKRKSKLRLITGEEANTLRKQATPGPWLLSGDAAFTHIIQVDHVTRDVWNVPRHREDYLLMATAPNLALTVEHLEEERGYWKEEALRNRGEASNWCAVRDLVHRLDAEARPGAKMADDDVLDVVSRVLNRAARPNEAQAENARLRERLRVEQERDLPLTPADPHLEMVQIQPPSSGSYSLISGEGETVAMTTPYWIGKYPVTLRVWRAVMGTSPSRAGGGDDAPVDSVSWHEAVSFCEKLSSMFGYDGSTPDRAPFRLPTEAEWEWAASGGIKEDRQVTPETGWYADNSGGHTHPVGLKAPNAFGLHDTLGNTWEWTDTAQRSYRVNRGGSWVNPAQLARVALRDGLDPGSRSVSLGLRLARG